MDGFPSISPWWGEAVLEVPRETTDPFLLPTSKSSPMSRGRKTSQEGPGQRGAMPVWARGEQQAGLACIYPYPSSVGLEMQERIPGGGGGGRAGSALCLQGRGNTSPPPPPASFLCHREVGAGRSRIFLPLPLAGLFLRRVSLRPSNGICLHPPPHAHGRAPAPCLCVCVCVSPAYLLLTQPCLHPWAEPLPQHCPGGVLRGGGTPGGGGGVGGW